VTDTDKGAVMMRDSICRRRLFVGLDENASATDFRLGINSDPS
jgi:hypothetical protein